MEVHIPLGVGKNWSHVPYLLLFGRSANKSFLSRDFAEISFLRSPPAQARASSNVRKIPGMVSHRLQELGPK